VKIVVAGCGKQAPKHIKAFQNLPDIDAIAVADAMPERAHEVAAQFGVAICENLDRALADDKVSAIVICTPTATHLPFVCRAIASGKHVLCEKPGGGSAAAMTAAKAGQGGFIVRIGYLYRFAPAIAESRRMMLGAEGDGVSPTLGRIRAARFRIGGQGSHAGWKHLSAHGGGAINEMMSHMIDLALWMFGPVCDCEVIAKNRVFDRRDIDGVAHTVDAEDYIAARLQTCSGVPVTIEADFLSARFWQHIEIRGDNGILVASIEPSFFSFCRLEPPCGGFPAGTRRLGSGETDLYALQAVDFLDAIRSREARGAGCDLGEAAQSALILEALRDAPFSPVIEPPLESARPWRAL
jgi:predicted dehydrogenase